MPTDAARDPPMVRKDMNYDADDELSIAQEVTKQHTQFWFRTATQIAITVVVYALLAAVMSMSRWISSAGAERSLQPALALTLPPEAGAAVMAVLATIVIALNVAVWGGVPAR